MKRKSRGQALVEFALVFPLIMTFLFASIEMGFYVYSWSQANYAARRGAEQASSGPPIRALADYHTEPDECVRLIRAAAIRTTIGIQASDVRIGYKLQANDTRIITDLSNPTIHRKAGNIMQVQVMYDYRPLTPVGDLFLSGRRIDATSRRTIVRYDFSSIDPLSVCR
ncbi:TadE family protein [Herpetosiphon llansteffanensis]|uniref:TadE family protein n=1 Tax=Herpetosiphon llansteffanensis TaxID=2094568 RepID=UPI000D7CD9FA|nr:TadE family protein [Herpetosiphon llansteffanensis]